MVDDLSQAALEKCIEEIKKHMEVTRGQIASKALKVIYRPADRREEGENKMIKIMCWFLGHKNNISCVDNNWHYTHDKCERCGKVLPIAYPWEKNGG